MRVHPFAGALSLGLFLCASAQGEIDPLQVWTADGGQAQMQLRGDYLPDFGIEVLQDGSSRTQMVDAYHSLTAGDHLVIEAPYGNFETLRAGAVRLDTGLALRRAGITVSLEGLTLVPGMYHNGHPSLEAYDDGGRHLLTLTHLHILAEVDRELLTIHNADVRGTATLAGILDEPLLDDLPLGMAWLDMPLSIPGGADTSGRGLSCSGRPLWPQDGHEVDVAMIQIGTVAYQGQDGSTGRIKVAPSATLKSVGEGDVPWIPKFSMLGLYPYSPPDQHPFLVWNMYRIHDGRIEMLGESGVKHAFLTLNLNCTINCGSGNVLWPGCEDVYSTGTNDSNSNQGPKEDIITSLGLFDSCDSFFSPGPGCSQTNNSGSFENRLMVDPAEFQMPGAEYFLDSWYVVQFDVDIWNSMAYHRINPSPSGGGWSFGPLGPFTLGPVLNEWVDLDNPGSMADHVAVVVPSATPDKPYPDNMPQGHINVLVRVTEPEPGRYRYNYAVQNFDFDRGVDAFRVALPAHAQVFETWFGDVNGNAGEAWTVSHEDGYLNFEAHPDNRLAWFQLFNFELETDIAPGDSEVVLDLGGDAVVPEMDVVIIGPEAGDPVPVSMLAIDVDMLDFGAVLPGDTQTLDMTLTGTGTAPVEITGLVGPDAPFSVDATDCGGTTFTLAPKASCVLAVSFAPDAVGDFTDSIQVQSDATNGPHEVDLSGIGAGAELFEDRFEAPSAAELSRPAGQALAWLHGH